MKSIIKVSVSIEHNVGLDTVAYWYTGVKPKSIFETVASFNKVKEELLMSANFAKYKISELFRLTKTEN